MNQLNLQTVRHLNAFACLAICLVLLMAQFLQLSLYELPCPLCLLQRVGFVGIAFGFLMNAYDRPHQFYYFISIISAVFTLSTGLRQVLLHIAPNTGAYGSAFLGLHLYTWSVVLASGFLIGIVLLLLLCNTQFDQPSKQKAPILLYRYIFILLIFITLMNALTTFSICGFEICPSNPTHYIWS